MVSQCNTVNVRGNFFWSGRRPRSRGYWGFQECLRKVDMAKSVILGTLLIWASLLSVARADAGVAQAFTFDGRLYSDGSGKTAMNDPNVTLITIKRVFCMKKRRAGSTPRRPVVTSPFKWVQVWHLRKDPVVILATRWLQFIPMAMQASSGN